MNLGGGIPVDRHQALVVKPPSDAKPAHPPALTVSTNPTPPLTPVADDRSPISFSGVQASGSDRRPVLLGPSAASRGISQPTILKNPLEFGWDLEVQRNLRGDPVEFGRGAWSIVYSAVCQEPEPVSPASNVSTNLNSQPDRVFAVKTPLRKDAYRILKAEALLLTRLSTIPGHESHLVPFLGYVSPSHSLVMEALPLTLASYITSRAAIARDNFSTKTMFDPIVGMSKWLSLSCHLVKGLAWLHDAAEIVHGDVKPQNILLREQDSKREDTFPFDLLYVDFTSSDDLSSSAACPKDHGLALSALTPPFAAPELLTISALKSSTLAPSKASDVFSLAVTLLTAVTGDLQLYPGAGSMQCLAMSRDGHRVLDFVRSGVNCSRVPRKGTVERILSPAIVKDPNNCSDDSTLTMDTGYVFILIPSLMMTKKHAFRDSSRLCWFEEAMCLAGYGFPRSRVRPAPTLSSSTRLLVLLAIDMRSHGPRMIISFLDSRPKSSNFMESIGRFVRKASSLLIQFGGKRRKLQLSPDMVQKRCIAGSETCPFAESKEMPLRQAPPEWLSNSSAFASQLDPEGVSALYPPLEPAVVDGSTNVDVPVTPLFPRLFIYRPGGDRVPLIAVDELPHSIVIAGLWDWANNDRLLDNMAPALPYEIPWYGSYDIQIMGQWGAASAANRHGRFPAGTTFDANIGQGPGAVPYPSSDSATRFNDSLDAHRTGPSPQPMWDFPRPSSIAGSQYSSSCRSGTPWSANSTTLRWPRFTEKRGQSVPAPPRAPGQPDGPAPGVDSFGLPMYRRHSEPL
ncbi:predicted protein [Uncinocarpus reesii 1704]|uniref:Protein kinase domain-containing protein n=1 Tax=Uncinocarpus reesii (strain UAMH 1704) TaxID=336963 RepID=C4JZN9_UNCRE|nr:uncharacterized protein UREG_07640 [Uncinocarpus reesii 1704]EEP82775.1 predicted protein [Uncinocarpus reesii 1704]